MPNGKIHKNTGMLLGAASALYHARQQSPMNALIETAGGAVTGWYGGVVADYVDPPTSGYHRSVGHGVVPASIAGFAWWKACSPLQAKLRAEADRQATLRAYSDGFWEAALRFLFEAVCRMLSGAIAGLFPAHASHLALDATTRAGIPLFG